MTEFLEFAHWLAALVVLVEALNKLERTSPLARGLTMQERLVDSLKAVSWALMALGAGGALIAPVFLTMGYPDTGFYSPLLRVDRPNLGETCVMVGFAVLIVRTRIKEG